MNITLLDNDNVLIKYVIPVVPVGVKFSQPVKHNSFETLKYGTVTIPGRKGLLKISWSSFFPVKKVLDFLPIDALYDGKEYVDFLDEHLEKEIRVVITDKNRKTIVNKLMTVSSFDWEYDKSGDIAYSISLEEFLTYVNDKAK